MKMQLQETRVHTEVELSLFKIINKSIHSFETTPLSLSEFF